MLPDLSDHADQIAAIFDLGAPVTDFRLAGRGEQGRVWRLQSDAGVFAVKQLLVRQDEAEASLAADFQEAVRLSGTVSVPRPRRARSGRVLAEVGPHQVRVYDWVDLLPPDQLADPVSVGATIAAVHRVRHEPARPLHDWYTAPVGAPRWQQLHRAAVAARAPFAGAFEAEIPILLELEALIEPPRSLQNCHRDLWADNVLPTPDGGLVVIDWESCGLEDPAYELPMALLDFGYGSPQRMHDLFASYRESGGPARLRGRGDFSMVIAQFGHFWESAVVAYTRPGATDDVREHNMGRVEMLLGQPLRVQDIDDTLDAVAGLS